MIRLVIVRHGSTAWNVRDCTEARFRGVVDLPLTDEGVTEALATAGRLSGLRLSAVYSSPLGRAMHTAQIIADPHGLTAAPLEGLGSMDYGDWAGRLESEVARRWPTLYQRWRQDPSSIQIPGGESFADLRDRACAAVWSVMDRHLDGETIALVSHQVVTKSLICTLTGLPDAAHWRFRQDLCNISRFDFDPDTRRFILEGLNDTCHLTAVLPSSAVASTRFISIRHGQTSWNAGAGEERFRGHTDLPLDTVGEAQAHALAERLQDETIDACFASPLLRARQTAEPLAAALGLSVQIHEGLLDIDYGHLQGLSHAQAAAAHPRLYTLWRTAPTKAQFPGGESLADVETRLSAFFDEMSALYPQQTVALVGHQIVKKVAACLSLGLGLDQIWQIRQATCGFNVTLAVNGGWYALGLNDRCHLITLRDAG